MAFNGENRSSLPSLRIDDNYTKMPITIIERQTSHSDSIGDHKSDQYKHLINNQYAQPSIFANHQTTLVRVVCISDTHNGHLNPLFDQKIRQIQADILVHAGDFSERGTREERIDFWNWLHSLKNFQYKIFISGNMDGIGLDKRRLKEEDRYPTTDSHLIYLENKACEVRGLTFYGCPYTPRFYGGFQYDRKSILAQQLWSQIPPDCDVLISHGPPAGIFDRTSQGSSVGCENLAAEIRMRPSIKAVIFGHVHNAHGFMKTGGKYFVNAAQNNGIHEGDVNNQIVELVFDKRTKKVVQICVY